ncbi:hypothetical protein HPB50_029364 [Hyalomma asiaticum]|nr:hypothetical protein HPB50_029364 [Hyalomma asiaticum]
MLLGKPASGSEVSLFRSEPASGSEVIQPKVPCVQESFWKFECSCSVVSTLHAVWKQAGAHTFTTTDLPRLGDPSTGPSLFDYYTRQPGKTRYDLVCRLARAAKSTDAECNVGYVRSTDVSQAGSERHDVKASVATFASPNEIKTRMSRAYSYNLGDTPLVVYDIDLDDFEGKCPGGALSPQVKAYATSTYES